MLLGCTQARRATCSLLLGIALKAERTRGRHQTLLHPAACVCSFLTLHQLRDICVISTSDVPHTHTICALVCLQGPLFVKYNGLLRGLQSDSNFLKNTMVALCCPRAIAEKFQGVAKMHELANGTLSFDEAERHLNRYTTTLHGINSAIIKLGKLTKATKVYRGITNMSLPERFWIANKFNVRGGIEPAFMSTTLERDVAMGYAAGGKMGIVIEAQQGMVSRGADVARFSQYPHEQVPHHCASLTWRASRSISMSRRPG